MGTLTSCLREAGKNISRDNRQQIMARAQALRQENVGKGMEPAAAAEAAALQAVDEQIAAVEALVERLRRGETIAPPAPEPTPAPAPAPEPEATTTEPAPEPEKQPEKQPEPAPEVKPPSKAAIRAAEREKERELYRDLTADSSPVAEGSLSDIEAAIRSRLGDVKLDDAKVAKLAGAIAKELKKKAAEREKNKHRDPAVYEEMVRDGMEMHGPVPPEREAAYRAGFQHAMKGHTLSSLLGENLPDRQRGYRDAMAWRDTETGAAWYEGRPASKLKNTGVDLRRYWDELKAQMKANESDAKKAWAQIERATQRAALFAPFLPDTAAPGFKLYVMALRDNTYTFKQWLENRSLNDGYWSGYSSIGDGRSWIDGVLEGERYPSKSSGADSDRFRDDESYRIQWLQDAAGDYLKAVQGMIDFLQNKSGVEDAAGAFSDRFIDAEALKRELAPDGNNLRIDRYDGNAKKVMNAAARALVYPENGKQRGNVFQGSGPDFVKMRPGSSFTTNLIANEKTAKLPDRATPLVWPRLDHITRGGPQVRTGDVTPAEFKKKFAFADVGFGNWVNGKEDQDHLNYSYDAFADLAAHIGMPTEGIGFGGWLHYTLGALGHGSKAAAHFSPNHPGPNGPVHVINLTKTKGDGTVGHEWTHALDFNLTGEWKRAPEGGSQSARSMLLGFLKDKIFDRAYIEAEARKFLMGNWRWTGRQNRNNTKVENAARQMRWLAHNRPKSAYKVNSDKLDPKYWGNDEELIARAAEAWLVDTMAGGNNYLVNPAWAGDGAVTAAKGFRGTPYPTGDERKQIVAVMGAFFKALKWDAKGNPTITVKDFKEALPDELMEGEKYRIELTDGDAMQELYTRMLDEHNATVAAAEAADAEKKRKEQEELDRLAAEQLAALRPPVVDPPKPDEASGPLGEDDLEAIFDQAAAEIAEASANDPETPPPATADDPEPAKDEAPATGSDGKPTAADATALIERIEKGAKIVFSGADWPTKAGLPTIHSFPSDKVKHLGFGIFEVDAPGIKGSWEAGGAMTRMEGTTVTSFSGEWDAYPREKVLEALRGVLPKKADKAPEPKALTREEIVQLLRDGHVAIGPFKVRIEEAPSRRLIAKVTAPDFNTVIETPQTVDAEGPSAFRERVADRLMAMQRDLRAPTTPPPVADKTAGELMAQAAKLGVKGADEALKGLAAIFGSGPGKLSSFPGGFDEEAYQKARPHFKAALEAFQAAGRTLKDLFKLLIQTFGDGVKPYAIRFAKDEGLTASLGAAPTPTPDEPAAAEVSPSRRLADDIARHLKGNGAPMTWQALFSMADARFGGTQAEGKYTVKDAYDALELGINLYIADNAQTFDPRAGREDALVALARLEALLQKVPTQTKRTAEQDEFQQFSTPPTLAYLASWVANLQSGDLVAEPSAGIGGLAVFAKNAGADVILNELSSRRAAVLQELFPGNKVYTHDAEQLNNVLPLHLKPTAVVMNPPFSNSATRGVMKDTMIGARHVEQALLRLQDGGRLVAIVGEGMARDKPAFRDWWRKIDADYRVMAAVPLDGAGYAKYGTTFDNVLLVIDKENPDGREPIAQKVSNYQELIPLLQEVRNARPSSEIPADDLAPAEQDAAESAHDAAVSAGEGDAGGGTGAGGAPVVGEGQSGGGSGGVAGGGGRGGSGGGAGGRAGNVRQPRTGPGTGGGQDAGGSSDRTGGAPGATEPAVDSDVKVGTSDEAPRAEGELTESVFEGYQPKWLKIEGARPHAGALVESAAMATVLPPKPTYTPNLPAKTITGFATNPKKPHIIDGGLSLAQLETTVYAGQAHSEMLPRVSEAEAPKRRGFFIGDGTGVGKGREIGGIILDNLRQGRKKHVWVSEKQGLIKDAQRDMHDVGGDKSLIFNQNRAVKDAERSGAKNADGALRGDGVVFTTYSTLRQGAKAQAQGGLELTMAQKNKLYPKGTPMEDNYGRTRYVDKWGKDKVYYSSSPNGYASGYSMPFNRVQSVDGKADWNDSKHLIDPNAKPDGRSRLDQLVEWLGADFDGVIALDEVHNAGNAISVKQTRGSSQVSQQALVILELQEKMPNARLVYVSATGATEVNNLAYASRLGLWGHGTAFANVQDFVAKIAARGLAAMELVARDLKQMGAYLARSLSFDGVTYGRIEHTLTDVQRDMYDRMAEAWQVTMKNMREAMEETGADHSGKAKGALASAYWGAQQRFFNQVLTSMQMPSILESMERDIANGDAVVAQLVNTSEAQLDRALSKRKEEGAEDEDDNDELEDLDLSPFEQLLEMVRKSFPVTQFVQTVDANGNTVWTQAVGADGMPIVNQKALEMREKLIKDLEAIRQYVPEGPLDQLVNHFGYEKVAEITGRSQRVVRDHEGKRIVQSRGKAAIDADAAAFQGDKKQLLVFSNAGGTGFSFHADRTKENQRRRKHYLVQPGWQANRAVQGFGRSHRTNQASAPHYWLALTDVPAQKRFISSIARRLDQLGALTKGQRDTANQGLFSEKDNLEGVYAHRAVRQFLDDLYAGRIQLAEPNVIEKGDTITYLEPRVLNVWGHDPAQLEKYTKFEALEDEEPGKGTVRAKRLFDGAVLTVYLEYVEGHSPRAGFLELMSQMGYEDKIDPNTGRISEKAIPEPRNFLNRMLSLKLEMQNAVFGAFSAIMDEMVEIAIQRGELDTGMQTIKALRATVKNEEVVFTDQKSGAETRYVELELENPTRIYNFPTDESERRKVEYFVNNKSGRVWARVPSGNQTLKDGSVVPAFAMRGTNGTRRMNAREFLGAKSGDFKKVEIEEARTLWEKENAAKPPTTKTEAHMLVGALLPIWDRVPSDGTIKVARTQTTDGRRLLGFVIEPKDLDDVRKRFNVSSAAAKMAPADVMAALLQGHIGELSNSWKLARARVSSELRIEIITGRYGMTQGQQDELEALGAIKERIEYANRFFVPTGAKGVEMLTKLFQSKPLVELKDPNAQPAGGPANVADDGMMGQGTRPARPMSAAAVQATGDRIASQWARAPQIVTLAREDDAPPKVRDDIAARYARGGRTAKAVFYDGKVYLFANNLTSEQEIAEFLYHEIEGHLGMRGHFGADLDEQLQVIERLRPAQIEQMLARTGKEDTPANRIRMAEEIVAYMAQTKPELGVVQRVIAAIRNFLRDHIPGFKHLTLKDSDIIQKFILPARGFATSGPDDSPGGGVRHESVAAETEPAEPMFAQADTMGLNNPRDFWRYAKEAVAELNEGTPGKLHWWHKTLGTQYNLAQKSPLYKRVFNRVQDFLQDVSLYATEAADRAPTILPKLDKWTDVLPEWAGGTANPLKAKDAKAIERPIYEGTLVWTRDENGRPVRVDDLTERSLTLSTDEMAHHLMRRNMISPNVIAMWQALGIDQYTQAVTTAYQQRMLRPGIVWADSELERMFGLDEGQRSLYREFRSGTDESVKSLTLSSMVRFVGEDADFIREQVMAAPTVTAGAELLRDQLLATATAEPTRNDQLQKTIERVMDIARRGEELISKGYAPLMRFGHYTVTAYGPNEETGEEEVKFFGMYESRVDARMAAQRLEANLEGATRFERGTMNEDAYKLFAGITPETAELFGEFLGLKETGDDAADKAFQSFLQLSKSSRSAMKRMIHRKGTAGFETDVGRVLAAFIYSNARQTSRYLHSLEIDEAVKAIPNSQGELGRQAVRLREYVKNPVEEAQALRGLLFAQYLGGSIASMLVNMTQPFAVTMPYLSQFGGMQAAMKRVLDASRVAFGGAVDDDALQRALKKAEEEGIVAPQEVHQLMAQGQGKGTLRSGDGTPTGEAFAAVSNFGHRLLHAWGKPFSTAELFNRRTTFVAAFRTAQDEGIANPYEFAERAVIETQFLYNKGNRPQWARGALGATLMTFKQYSISYLELMERMWNAGEPGSPERAAGRRAVFFAAGMLLLFGGLSGLPFEQDAEDLIDGVMQRLGYNWQTNQKKREMLQQAFGKAFGTFLEKGVSGLPGAPIDVANRLGLGNLIPGSGVVKKKADHARDIVEVLGPVGDLAQRAGRALDLASDGELLQATGEIAPIAARNVAKAIDMASTGQYRDARNYKIIDVTAGDVAAKAIGFQPRAVAQAQEADRSAQEMVNVAKQREAEIAAKWAKGFADGDEALRQEARAELNAWNEKNPATPIRIKIGDVLRRANKMKQSRADRIEATAPREVRQEAKRILSQE